MGNIFKDSHFVDGEILLFPIKFFFIISEKKESFGNFVEILLLFHSVKWNFPVVFVVFLHSL